MPTVLITGANRGLGRGLTDQYLSNGWTVLACVRDVSSMPAQKGLEVFKLDLTSLTDAKIIANELLAVGTKIDLIISNAAVSLEPAGLADTSPAMLDLSWQTNTRGPLLLFQAMRPHLAENAKVVFMSSTLGCLSIKRGGKGAYGMSYAASNYMVRKLHVEHPELVIMAVDPGHMQTHMGDRGARWYNNPLAKNSVEHVAPIIAGLIESGEREKHGGNMVHLNGEIEPY